MRIPFLISSQKSPMLKVSGIPCKYNFLFREITASFLAVSGVQARATGWFLKIFKLINFKN